MGERQRSLEGLVVIASTWAGRKVLLTGHTGFKGSWLSLMLLERGAEVVGFSLPAEGNDPSLFSLAGIAREMDSRSGDIRDAEALRAVLRDAEPEIVIHMAAQALVRESYETPIETYATNVLGTVHLLDAVRDCDSVRAVVNVTSDKCYENREWEWPYRETDVLGGHDPYSNSKACAELVSSAYSRSFLTDRGVSVATARAGNVIGGGDWASDRLVPDAVRAFAAGNQLEVRNPLAVRPWQHVLEPLAGYLQLCDWLYGHEGASFDSWNFGPAADDARSVGHVADALVAAWGDTASWSRDPSTQPHEARLLSLDSSKARSQLGWRPQFSADAAIQRTVAWYRLWAADGDVRAATLGDIADYERMANAAI